MDNLVFPCGLVLAFDGHTLRLHSVVEECESAHLDALARRRVSG